MEPAWEEPTPSLLSLDEGALGNVARYLDTKERVSLACCTKEVWAAASFNPAFWESISLAPSTVMQALQASNWLLQRRDLVKRLTITTGGPGVSAEASAAERLVACIGNQLLRALAGGSLQGLSWAQQEGTAAPIRLEGLRGLAPSLKHLELTASGPLPSLGPLGALTALQELRLACPGVPPPLGPLGALPHLQELHLAFGGDGQYMSQAQLEEGLAALADMKGLETVGLHVKGMAYLPDCLDPLWSSPKLQALDLSGSCSLASLPWCLAEESSLEQLSLPASKIHTVLTHTQRMRNAFRGLRLVRVVVEPGSLEGGEGRRRAFIPRFVFASMDILAAIRSRPKVEWVGCSRVEEGAVEEALEALRPQYPGWDFCLASR